MDTDFQKKPDLDQASSVLGNKIFSAASYAKHLYDIGLTNNRDLATAIAGFAVTLLKNSWKYEDTRDFRVICEIEEGSKKGQYYTVCSADSSKEQELCQWYQDSIDTDQCFVCYWRLDNSGELPRHTRICHFTEK